MATKIKANAKMQKLADEKGTGPEPVWDTERALKMDEAEFDHHLRQSFNYYNYHYSPKDLKKHLVAWMQDSSYKKEDVSNFIRSSDRSLPMTACSLVVAHKQGMPLKEPHVKYLRETIEHVTNLVDFDEVQEEGSKKVTAPSQVKTIQDRLQEKTNEHLAHFDGIIDEVVKGKKVDSNAFDYFKANSVPQAQLSRYEEYAETYVNELKEAQLGTDEDLTEAYSHYRAADFRRIFGFFEKFQDAIEQYRQVKKQTKKAKVKRAPNKEKSVSKMKYMKEDNTLKLVSINPVDIIGAQELWVYNVKTRKMFKYVADDTFGPLSVKGTSILGYDTAKSQGKTVRKPEQKLLEFMKAGKVQLRKFLDEIKAVSIPANGRINNDILLLKAL